VTATLGATGLLLFSIFPGENAMRISRNDLAAMSRGERERVRAEMAHPSRAAKRPRASAIAFVLHALFGKR
jgi:hypothetical protein